MAPDAAPAALQEQPETVTLVMPVVHQTTQVSESILPHLRHLSLVFAGLGAIASILSYLGVPLLAAIATFFVGAFVFTSALALVFVVGRGLIAYGVLISTAVPMETNAALYLQQQEAVAEELISGKATALHSELAGEVAS